MEENKINRYPGITAFETNQESLFFGRQQETKRLFSLVKTKSLVVLFGKSGLGKSSIINAGLIPKLEDDFFHPIKVRLQDITINPIKALKKEFEPFLKRRDLEKYALATKRDNITIWEYINACDFGNSIPVIIFDQFEEFFEHKKELQEALILELADLISERLPSRIQDQLRKIPFEDRTEELLEWYTPIPIKIIFAIRSDRLSLLDELSNEIPGILNNRFHLRPLKKADARDAIIEPAQIEGNHFDTLPFEYEENLLNAILDYLSNKENEIEPFQLQLICQNIEKKIKRKNA